MTRLKALNTLKVINMVDITDMVYEDMVTDLLKKAEAEGYQPKKKRKTGVKRSKRFTVLSDMPSICDIDDGTFENHFILNG